MQKHKTNKLVRFQNLDSYISTSKFMQFQTKQSVAQSIFLEKKMMESIFDSYGRYILPDYDRNIPFTNFLPGIAGLDGVPMWVFYVNRGQGISSFGVGSKDSPIMEFQPANKAYRFTSLYGYRTFIKIFTEDGPVFHEPFFEQEGILLERRMSIGSGEFEIEELNEELGLQVNVLYYTIPHENFAALARVVTIKNLSGEKLALEILDGMPVIIPFGINNFFLKEMGRTIEAWMEVFNLENDIPFYKVRASVEDSAEVHQVQAGNFSLAFLNQAGGSKQLKSLVDPKVIFGPQLSFQQPEIFCSTPLEEITKAYQRTLGQTPCSFFGAPVELEPDSEINISSLYGNTGSLEDLQETSKRIDQDYFAEKLAQNRKLLDELSSPIEIRTGDSIFDAYAKQTYLDNILRGGMPLSFNQGKAIYHVYSRKHGDPERDYNYFYLAPEYFSQGNGNYRDVNQNRRSDVLFYPQVGDFNIRFFLSLIQLDGYNPLVISGTKFLLEPEALEKVLPQLSSIEEVRTFFSEAFTPGSLLKFYEKFSVEINASVDEFFELVFAYSEQMINAVHGEGYWIDHWTYNLDLLDSYLAVYPDQKAELLFGRRDIPWYESYARVQPREQRYTPTRKGLRQYGSVMEDEDKQVRLAERSNNPAWVRASSEPDQLYHSSVFEKLFILLVVKAATLDPEGMGVEMEAGKPGWYDALNGLPGIFGSSTCETYEMARLVMFLKSAMGEDSITVELKFPAEFCELLEDVVKTLEENFESYDRWDRLNVARERYFDQIFEGISGLEKDYNADELKNHLASIEGLIFEAIKRIENLSGNLPATYFYYEVEQNEGGHLSFEQRQMPKFLEGCVHAMRVADAKRAEEIYHAVRESDLFDRNLGMYKVNESLAEASHEMGRASAFPAGWLENESVWLHMEYKYLLEVLRSGLYEEFYQDIRTALIPFQPPERYGRSPLENSSFLASSAYPDPSLHGNGFVARLSGATAEFLSLWFEMFVGRDPFNVDGDELSLAFKPRLANWLFPEDGMIEFSFFGQTQVTYHNPLHLNTWEAEITEIELVLEDGKEVNLAGAVIPAPYALQVREGHVSKIKLHFGEQSS